MVTLYLCASRESHINWCGCNFHLSTSSNPSTSPKVLCISNPNRNVQQLFCRSSNKKKMSSNHLFIAIQLLHLSMELEISKAAIGPLAKGVSEVLGAIYSLGAASSEMVGVEGTRILQQGSRLDDMVMDKLEEGLHDVGVDVSVVPFQDASLMKEYAVRGKMMFRRFVNKHQAFALQNTCYRRLAVAGWLLRETGCAGIQAYDQFADSICDSIVSRNYIPPAGRQILHKWVKQALGTGGDMSAAGTFEQWFEDSISVHGSHAPPAPHCMPFAVTEFCHWLVIGTRPCVTAHPLLVALAQGAKNAGCDILFSSAQPDLPRNALVYSSDLNADCSIVYGSGGVLYAIQTDLHDLLIPLLSCKGMQASCIVLRSLIDYGAPKELAKAVSNIGTRLEIKDFVEGEGLHLVIKEDNQSTPLSAKILADRIQVECPEYARHAQSCDCDTQDIETCPALQVKWLHLSIVQDAVAKTSTLPAKYATYLPSHPLVEEISRGQFTMGHYFAVVSINCFGTVPEYNFELQYGMNGWALEICGVVQNSHTLLLQLATTPDTRTEYPLAVTLDSGTFTGVASGNHWFVLAHNRTNWKPTDINETDVTTGICGGYDAYWYPELISCERGYSELCINFGVGYGWNHITSVWRLITRLVKGQVDTGLCRCEENKIQAGVCDVDDLEYPLKACPSGVVYRLYGNETLRAGITGLLSPEGRNVWIQLGNCLHVVEPLLEGGDYVIS